MSWNAYIDSICDNTVDPTTGTKHCDKAAIIGMNGSMWTTCEHTKAMKPEQAEITKIVNAIQSGDNSPLQAGGIIVEGVKYQFLRADPSEKLIMGKKKDHGAITIQGTKTAVVIGHTQEGCQQGFTNDGIQKVVDYLQGIDM